METATPSAWEAATPEAMRAVHVSRRPARIDGVGELEVDHGEPESVRARPGLGSG